MPVTKVREKLLVRDGILRVGKKYADKLVNEAADPWFENIGESSISLLLKLYSQVLYMIKFVNYRISKGIT